MSKGIYKYVDLRNGEIVYIGKDSNINKKKRFYAHNIPSTYDKQPFNRILQNNPERYEYSVVWESEDCSDLKLNKMEILFGKIYNPRFNFGKFGKGGCKGHTEETKRKISKNNAKYWEGKTRPEETRQKMSKGKIGTKNAMKCKYGRIATKGFCNGKQRYCIRYNGKVLKQSVDIHKLIDWWNENYLTEPLYVEVYDK